MQRIKRRLIPYYIVGEEVGGIIIGRWLSDAELKGSKYPYEVPLEPMKIPGATKDPDGKTLIRQLEHGTKINGIYYCGGLVQLPNRAKKREREYILPNRYYIIARLTPLLLTKFIGLKPIGLWHSHPPGHGGSGPTDRAAADLYLKQWKADRILLAVESGGEMDIQVIHAKNRTFNNKW